MRRALAWIAVALRGLCTPASLLRLSPSSAPVTLSLSLPAVPRDAIVLEAPGGDVAVRALMLNRGPPASAAGALPPLASAFCGGVRG